LVAGVATSHVPAIGAAIDQGKTQEPYWQPLFKGYEPAKQWIAEQKPDVIILVYNDHASAFSLDMIPTFAPAQTPPRSRARRWGSFPVKMRRRDRCRRE
jgi:protocatechuate 4,5-dioxygenase beta chain